MYGHSHHISLFSLFCMCWSIYTLYATLFFFHLYCNVFSSKVNIPLYEYFQQNKATVCVIWDPNYWTGILSRTVMEKLELNGPSMMSNHIRLETFLNPSLSVSLWPFSLFHQSMLIWFDGFSVMIHCNSLKTSLPSTQFLFKQQQHLGQIFGTIKMYLNPTLWLMLQSDSVLRGWLYFWWFIFNCCFHSVVPWFHVMLCIIFCP